MTKPVNSLFFRLNGVMDGKPFDGVLPGTFTDMYGREVTFTPQDLRAFAKNTTALIASKTNAAGEIVGLPIDAQDHEGGQAAGWIVGVELADDQVIKIQPEWTNLGRKLISEKLMQFFSSTIDLEKKVILGGTLTNWPAMQALRPIELCADLFAVEPQTDTRLEIRKVTVGEGGLLVGNPAADPDPTENLFTRFKAHLWDIFGTRLLPAREAKQTNHEELINMEMTAEQLSKLVGEAVDARFAARLESATPPANGETRADLMALLEMGNVQDEVAQQLRATMLEQYDAMKKRATLEAAEHIASLRREAQVVEFCQRVTGGTAETPRGLPADAAQLRAQLLALTPDQAKFWQNLLEVVVRDGLTEFTEIGHGRILKANQPLPEEIVAKLDSGALTLADLKNPILSPALGDLQQYDLSKWKE